MQRVVASIRLNKQASYSESHLVANILVAYENSRPLGPGAKKDGCFRRLKF